MLYASAGPENKSARFDSRNEIHVRFLIMLAQRINQRVKSVFILQQGGDVIEKYSRLRIIRNFPDQFFQIFHLHVSTLHEFRI